jgi:hypothetical protein
VRRHLFWPAIQADAARSHRAFALGHQAVHAAAAVAGEAVAAVYGAAVVPDDQIADLPRLGPGEFVPGGVVPKLVEERPAFLERKLPGAQ